MSRLAAINRPSVRRLTVCVLALAAVDQAVPVMLARSEAARYESGRQVRFENSDLFMLGPLTEYFKEHPVGRKPRVVFFGNSMIWGYGLMSEDTIPFAFQRLASDAQVLNLAVNGFESGNAYLISKAVIDAVDVFYLFHIGDRAHPMLPKLILVSPEDAARFGLERPSAVEESWKQLFGFWRLPRYSYRLQAAWFGTSTRQYLYIYKGEWVRRMLGGTPQERDSDLPMIPPEGVTRVTWDVPRAAGEVPPEVLAQLAKAQPLLWDYGQLLARHQKHGVIIEWKGGEALSEEQRAAFNAHFHPYVMMASLSIPGAWRQADWLHLTAEGDRGVAWVLHQRTAKAFGLVSG